MFSSLPSASKIYVSSTKPKQKGLSSAKRKRKKTTCSLSISSHDEETLVASTSARKNSVGQVSLNSHLSVNEERITSNEIPSCFGTHNVHLDGKSKTDNSEIKTENGTLHKNICDMEGNAYCDTDLYESENFRCYSGTIDKDSNNELDETSLETIQHPNVFIQNNNILPEAQQINISNLCEESEQTITQSSETEYDINDNNPVITIVSEDKLQSSPVVSNNNDLIQSEKIFEHDSGEDLCKVQSFVSNTGCGLLGENLNSELCDSNSVKSDCYMSTDIYHVHVDTSEHSSIDETETGQNGKYGEQSPKQSETSYTESMCNVQSASQSELTFNYSSVSEVIECKNQVNQNEENRSIISQKVLREGSYSIADFRKVICDEQLKHSISLPENISEASILRNLLQNNHNHVSFEADNHHSLSKSKATYDKQTSTLDLRLPQTDQTTGTTGLENSLKDTATTPIKLDSVKTNTKDQAVSTSFQDASKIIMKVLPPVGMMQARSRSYMFGSVGSPGSLLGNEELTRYFPDYKVTVFIGTWNMNGLNPPESIDDFLLPLDVSSMPDIYAVGVQEGMQSRSEWEILLQTTLGPSHVLFASTSFGVLHLSILMRRDLIWFCSEPEEASIATRPGSMIKTKGAVAICFIFFGTSFLFLNSHLTAHEQNLKERLSDYEKICSSLDLPKFISLKSHQKSKDVTSRFDCVFWCGDLNFRIVQDRSSVMSFVEKIKQPVVSQNLLLEHDQLSQAMAKGVVFHEFNEGVINFIPSYKFDVGTSSFDSIKQRVPSYTDRILYRSKDPSSIVCLNYNAVSEISTSDHKPVFAIFNVIVQPGGDNIPLAAGLFKRNVYLEAIKRRAQQLEFTRNHKQSTVCNVM